MFRDHNYRQTWAFGSVAAARVGADSEWIGVWEGEHILGMAHVRLRRISLIGGGIAYINGGPLVRRAGEENLGLIAGRLEKVLAALKKRYVCEQGLSLRLVGAVGTSIWNNRQAEVLANAGFDVTHKVRQYRTLMKYVSEDDADLRIGLQQKWRNCLNAALRNDLLIETGVDGDRLARFARLFETTRERKGFTAVHDANFFATVQATCEAGEPALDLYLVRQSDQDVAGYLGMSLGDTSVYLLGASTELGRRTKASYLIQWQAMLSARARGCLWHDLGGIDPEANPGVFAFKSGLGGEDVVAAGPVECQPTGWRASLTSLGERAYLQTKRLTTRSPR